MASTGSSRVAPTALDKSLVRAVGVRTVLRCCCSSLRSQDASESNYTQSFETTRIADFLSHDWGTGRWGKALGLCLVYNSLAALLASLVLTIVLAVLQHGDDAILPCPKPEVVEWGSWADRVSGFVEEGYWCQLLCPLIFAIFFLFWQDMRALMGFGSRSCFVDKFCIEQSNAEKKAAGIIGLAGFLRCSERLLVLWSPEYFTRLWCTYEVASWLHLQKPLNSVLLMPLAHAKIVSTLMLAWSCACVVITFCFFLFPSLFIAAVVIGSAAFLTVGAHQARYCTRHLRALQEQLGNFSITSSRCYCCTVQHKQSGGEEIPCDREVVYATLAEWFGDDASGEDQLAGPQAALDRFDQTVRTQFAPKVLGKAGPTKLSYRYAILVGWPFLFRCGDVWTASGDGSQYITNALIIYPTMALLGVPVWYKVSMYIACAFDWLVGIPRNWLANYLATLALASVFVLLVLIMWVPLELLALSGTDAWPTVYAALGYTVAAAGLYAQDLPEFSNSREPTPTSEAAPPKLPTRNSRLNGAGDRHRRSSSKESSANAQALAAIRARALAEENAAEDPERALSPEQALTEINVKALDGANAAEDPECALSPEQAERPDDDEVYSIHSI